MSIFIIVFFLSFSPCFAIKLKDITGTVFPNASYLGLIAAFGDFNSDKLTDLFCIKQDGKVLEILFSNDTHSSFGLTKLYCSFKDEITGIIPGDYNGDTMMDILVTLRQKNSPVVRVVVLWGSLDNIDCNTNVVMNMSSQPFILDYNEDMIPDIMSDDGNNRYVWVSSSNRTFKPEKFEKSKQDKVQKLKNPHSCAVLDLNNDLVSDLFITGVEKIELWIKNGNHFILNENLAYPLAAKINGQFTFVDFNMDSEIDKIIPVCYDVKCHNSTVLLWDKKNKGWTTVANNFTYKGDLWGFISNDEKTGLEASTMPITLRFGDFNLDGYPDFITVVENKKSKKRRVIILENTICSDCTKSQRKLSIHWNIESLDSIDNVQFAAFIDVHENGILDVIVSSKTDNKWKTHIFENVETYDAYFVKFLVLSGICSDNCSKNRIPYGTNQPGPMIRINTTKPDGDPLSTSAVQMPQSAYFSLNLPYTVFGLGQIPNFVDHLEVSIPVMKNNYTHSHEWTQIIPNSQMVVIPYPPENSKLWVNKLFLTPSNLVVKTCFALIGTCGFIGLIILMLHWRERREDKREKMQDAYRFHFDAM